MQGRRVWARIARADRGATAVEYGLLVAAVAVVTIPALALLSDRSSDTFQTTLATEDGVTVCADGDPNCTAFNALPAANLPGVPVVTTLAAGPVGATSATLNGTVNANGNATTVTFCYGTAADLAGCAVVSGAPGSVTGTSATAVTASLPSLSASTQYYYRVIGTSAKGTRIGATLTFTTGTAGASAPTASTVSATGIGSNTATLNGFVVPGGSDTTVRFCYDTQSNLNGCTLVTATPGTVSGTSGLAVSAAISGLANNRRYYFEVRATNAVGTDTGSTLNFTTGAAPTLPTVTTTTPATAITATGATLGGTVDANGGSFTTSFCYGTTTPLNATCSNGTSAAASPSPVTGNSATGIALTLSGLSPSTQYYFRAGATSGGTTTYGTERTFTTSAASITPTVTTNAVTGTSATGATLSGSVNANGGSFSTSFCYGTTSPLAANCSNGTLVAGSPVTASGSTATAVSAVVSGLQPGTTYYVRAQAQTGSTVTPGSERSFTTTCALVLSWAELGSASQTVNLMAGISGGGLTATPVRTSGSNTGSVALVPASPTTSVVWSGYNGSKTWTGTFTWSSAGCSAGTGSLSLASK